MIDPEKRVWLVATSTLFFILLFLLTALLPYIYPESEWIYFMFGKSGSLLLG